ncbi:MAG: methionyl-tRNA formyltransferase [Candidatus Kerfeldbacteria bacterium]|nr:methionyl-tRNA formyltransferase [Candidatus Kerfeldbacteria bacterium]
MNRRPRAVFFGTPSFAVPILEALGGVAEIAAVVTQPDQPAGRGQNRQPSPVNRRARELGVPVLVPAKLDHEFIYQFNAGKPDLAVLAAYGKILPLAVLAVPPKGFVNVHPSLLPRHRGPSPVAATLLAGDPVTGVTLIVLDEEMDHGPIIAQQTINIGPHEHRPALERRLANLGANVLRQALLPYCHGWLQPQPQNHALATFCKLLKKTEAPLTWKEPADMLERKIRAFDPWPGTHTSFNGRRLKILDAEARAESAANPPGTVIIDDETPTVVCGAGQLRLKSLQLAGQKPTAAVAFAHGHRDFVGAILGS